MVTHDDRGDTMSDLGLPSQVLTEIGSPIRETRLTGVDELTRLASGADLAMAAAARQALRGLTEDDSRSVAAAAAAALERTAVRLDPDRVDFGQVPADTPRLVADVRVDGPPLAVETATVAVSGPGLRALLTGRQLRILWMPRSDWLDGSVTVRGPAGWADVRVTGQLAPAAPMSRAAVEARLRAVDGGDPRGARVTVLPAALPPPPARRRRVGAAVLIAALTVLVLLGGVGVAMALTGGPGRKDPSAAAPTATPAEATASTEASAAPAPSPAVSRAPVTRRVVSLAKPAVLTTVRVGAEPEGVAVSPDGRTVFVANQSSRVLSVVDAASRRVTSLRLRNTPRFVSVSRDGLVAFVSMYEKDMSGSGMAVIDTVGRKVVRYVPTGVQPFALAVAPDGRIWVPIHSQGRVEVYGAGDQRRDSIVAVPPNPHAVAFSPDLMRAFTADHESNAMAIIDMRTDKMIRSVPVSKAPHSIAVSPDGRTVLVAGYEAAAADLVDAVTLKRTGPLRVGRQPQCVAFSTDGAHAYVVNEADNTVSVLDGHTGKVTATVRVGRSPRTIAVAPDGRLAYVTNGLDNTVSVLRVGA
jgi:YVTN family beta-propeller protein